MAVLEVIISALAVYLSSMAKIDFVQTMVKNSVKRLVLFTLLFAIVLLSIWVSVLGLIFFYLISVHLTPIQIMLILLGVNLLGLVVMLILFTRVKRQALDLRRSGMQVMLAYIIKILDEGLQKSK